MVSVLNNHPPAKVLTTRKYPRRNKGVVKEIRIVGDKKFLITCFEDGQICMYDLKECTIIKEYNLNPQQTTTNLFLDDHCSLYAQLDKSKTSLNIEFFDWHYKIDRVVKFTRRAVDSIMSKSQKNIKKMVDEEQQLLDDAAEE